MTIVIDGTTGISSIGTLTGVTSVSSASANTPVILGDSGTNYNTCRAWVNFNGTGTVAIRASFNVTSITDNGTGDYTVNFTNAMPDANYCAVATNNRSDGTYATISFKTTTPFATTTARFQSSDNDNNIPQDALFACVAVFR